MIGVRVKFGEIHAAIQVKDADHRTEVHLACGPTLHIDKSNRDRFTFVSDPPLINCYSCRENTEPREADEQ